MTTPRPEGDQRSATAALAVVEALYAFAEEPARWEDVIAAIDGLPDALDPVRDAVAQSITNHALRAAALAEKLNTGRHSRQPASAAWDAILVSGEARVRAVTGRAQERLEPFLRAAVAQGSELQLNARSADALARALSGIGRSRLSLTPVTFSSDDDTNRVFAIALARDAFPESLTKTFGLGEMWAEPLFAIVLLTSRDLMHDRDLVRQGLGLTAAEAKLAARLGSGVTLADAAADLGIAFHTARTQLKHIFSKTGARRQSELVGLIGDLAAIAPARAGDAPLPPLATAPPRRFVDLPDGRRLFYREYGVPNGRPAIYFHVGTAASFLLPSLAQAALEARLRLVAFDRPGYGHSTACADYTLESVAADVETLMDRLKFGSVSLLGDGTGGAFAVATANLLRDRVRCLALRAPRLRRTPAGAPGSAQSIMSVLSRQPWAIRGVADLVHRSIHTSFLRSLLKRHAGLSASDASAAGEEEFMAGFEAAVFDAFELSGAGLASELNLFAAGAFADPALLDCPIRVWHGEEHSSVPASESLSVFAGHPTAEVCVLPRMGIYLPPNIMSEICQFLASSGRAAS